MTKQKIIMFRTLKSGLKLRPTTKLAAQLTSAATLEAATRFDCPNNSAVISHGIGLEIFTHFIPIILLTQNFFLVETRLLRI